MPQPDFFTGLLLIAFAIGIGAWSERKGGSFAAGFFASILLTPLVAGLILALRRRSPTESPTEYGVHRI
jgi:hypothetical protein